MPPRTAPSTRAQEPAPKRKPGRPKGTIKTGNGHPRGKVADPFKYRDPEKDPPSKRGGRPPLLTPEVQTKFLSLIRLGGYFDDACDACDLAQYQVEEWIRRGLDDENTRKRGRLALTRYQEFALALRRAQADASFGLLGQARKGEKGAEIALRILGIRWPHKWREKSREMHLQVDVTARPPQPEIRGEVMEPDGDFRRYVLALALHEGIPTSEVLPIPPAGEDPGVGAEAETQAQAQQA